MAGAPDCFPAWHIPLSNKYSLLFLWSFNKVCVPLPPSSPPKLGGWGSEQTRGRSKKDQTRSMIKEANITNSNKGMQKNSDSLASFNALYLHISEKVLTHTHTHTHRTWRRDILGLRLRARVRHALNTYKQRAFRSSLCSLFYALSPTGQGGNKHDYLF